jgi:hypothetical protein
MLVSVSQSDFRDYVIMFRGIILDRVDSITDLGVVTVRCHFLGILGLVKRLSSEFRDHYTLRTLYVSLVRPKLEYASRVWRPFYDMHISRIERVQRKFVRYALQGLGWTDMYDLRPYVDRCTLNGCETLTSRRSDACVMFVFDALSGRVCSSHSGWRFLAD